MKLFVLTSTDLTHLGGPMGTEYTTTNWHKYFTTIKRAQLCAERNYAKYRKESIEWGRKGRVLSSGDLGFVMYKITPVKINSLG